ncbi:MAG: glycoside hydrolase domain-containing protein [Planctomycetota bacterium]
MARNESEAFQVLVRGKTTGSEPLSEISVTIEPVERDSNSKPSWMPEIKTFQVLDVLYDKPAEDPTFKIPPTNTGWIPDVCLPSKSAKAQNHRPGEIVFLFDVKTPPLQDKEQKGPVSFDYRLKFSEAGKPQTVASLLLSVQVFPIEIPARLPFRTGFHWNWEIDKYLGRELTETERLAYLDFCLEYRFTPGVLFDKGPNFSEAEIKIIKEKGGTLFQIFHLGGGGKKVLDDKQKEKFAPQLKSWRDQMGKLGVLNDCFALIADEPPPEAIPAIRKNGEWLKTIFPELKLWVASRPGKELLDLIDVWDMVVAHSTDHYALHSFTEESLRLVRDNPKNAGFWWFFSVEPYQPHPNCRLDNDLIDSRAIGWMSFYKGVEGFVYFWPTAWGINKELRDVPFPEKAEKWKPGLAGAGVLFYPGNDSLPIPSLRLINLRDGMEDWALFRLAGDDLRKIAPFETRDPQNLAELRRQAFRAILQNRFKTRSEPVP